MSASILVADDHELVRDGIRGRIERHEGWTVTAEAANGRQAVELALRLKPDVAVLDIGMPELNGIAAAVQIRRACPGTEVLILTMLQSDEAVREAIAAGARGFILKTDASQLLIAAIESLLVHKPFFTGAASDLVLSGYLDPAGAEGSQDRRARRLTAREVEVVQLLAESLTNKEVASRLSVSVKTVEAHRSNIMRKLGAHSVTELVRYAVRNRIVEP